jgi:hypothetical protein
LLLDVLALCEWAKDTDCPRRTVHQRASAISNDLIKDYLNETSPSRCASSRELSSESDSSGDERKEEPPKSKLLSVTPVREGTLPHTPPPILRAAQLRATLVDEAVPLQHQVGFTGDVSHGIAVPSALAADHTTAPRKPASGLKIANGLESNGAVRGRGSGLLAQAEEDISATAVGERLARLPLLLELYRLLIV